MSKTDYGWAWFESFRDHGLDPNTPRTADPELAIAFARCFHGKDGQLVLRHLRAVTLDRSLGPGASDIMLRHLEGQRSLVIFMMSMAARGASGTGAVTTAAGPDTDAQF